MSTRRIKGSSRNNVVYYQPRLLNETILSQLFTCFDGYSGLGCVVGVEFDDGSGEGELGEIPGVSSVSMYVPMERTSG